MAQNDYNSDAYELSSPDTGSRLARGMRKLGHVLAAIPGVGALTGMYATILTGCAALFESGSSLIEGQYSRSAKQLISGAVDTLATAAAPVFWITNPLVGLVSGSTIPEHLRQLTNWSLDSVGAMFSSNKEHTDYARRNRVIGADPMTRGHVMAGVGWSPYAGQMQTQAMTGFQSYDGSPQAPRNYFTNRVAEERGVDPEQLRRNWLRDEDNRQHFQDLVAAGRGGPSVTGRA